MCETSAQQVSQGQYGSGERVIGVAQHSQEGGMDLNAQDKNQITPSYLLSNPGPLQIAILLLHHGANLDARKNEGENSLCRETEGEYYIQGDRVGIKQQLTRA